MYQKIVLVGHLGSDPEMRYLADGTPVTSFSIATNDRWNDKSGELQERTTWWRISAWRRLAETCNEYLRKGRLVLVEGRVNPDPDTGSPRVFQRNDGTSGASYEITAFTVKFLGGRGDTQEVGTPPSGGDTDVEPEEIVF